MKPLGALKELNPDVDGAVTLLASGLELDPTTKSYVIQYLSSGLGVLDVMEATSDPRQTGHTIPGGSSLVTDGIWCWRLDLPAYIEAYNLSLPESFVAIAVKSAGRPAKNEITEDDLRKAISAWGWA